MNEPESEERWAEVPGSRGRYEASTAGRVRSWVSNSGARRQNPKMLSLIKQRYLRVGLSVDGVRTLRSVHSVVAETFLGPAPLRMEVCHKNGDAHDNRVCNLRYGTSSDNQQDRILHGTMPRGQEHGRAVLTQEQVRAIRARHAGGDGSYASLASEYGVSKALIARIVQRKVWAWLDQA